MKDIEFNLIDEKWIRVIDGGCHIDELSLTELFRGAQDYADLCGELSAQDVAVMRILLAILHTVILRYDESGAENEADTAEELIDRWKAIWDSGRFPSGVIEGYLESQRDRFWLFHPSHPFMQEPLAEYGTKYTASKLNGELSESNNKSRLFRMLAWKEKETLTVPQAARWLLYANGFDDTSAKPSALSRSRKVKYASPGAGWLGKLGLITLQGENLFETLMLNLVMSFDGSSMIGDEQCPAWERDGYVPRDPENIRIERVERVNIAMPDNLAELYTLRSRKILLERGEDGITGCSLLGGEFFERENAFIEPMTVWRQSDDKKRSVCTPKRHDPSKQFWREFASVYPKTDSKHRRPGVLSWFGVLMGNELLPKGYKLRTRISSVQYGDKDFFITNVFADTLSMSGELIYGLNREWERGVLDSIELTDDIAKTVGALERDIYIAGGGDTEKAREHSDKAKEQYYFEIDEAFRLWLASIDPQKDTTVSEKKQEWLDRAIKAAERIGEKMVSGAGTDAIIGRVIKTKEAEVRYSAAKAENFFKLKLGKIKKGVTL